MKLWNIFAKIFSFYLPVVEFKMKEDILRSIIVSNSCTQETQLILLVNLRISAQLHKYIL